MDRSRFSTHKRLAFLLAGVLLVLLGILGGWHVLSRQAQWTVLDQAALENAGDAHLRSLSQQAEQCAGAHDFLWTGEPVELTNRLSSEAHAFLPVCAIAPADVPKYGDAAWEVEFSLLTTWDGEEPPAWVPKLSVSQWELELDPGINTGLTGPDWHSAGGARWYALTQADASLWQEARNGTPPHPLQPPGRRPGLRRAGQCARLRHPVSLLHPGGRRTGPVLPVPAPLRLSLQRRVTPRARTGSPLSGPGKNIWKTPCNPVSAMV